MVGAWAGPCEREGVRGLVIRWCAVIRRRMDLDEMTSSTPRT
jgi:hypothetical protein